MRAKWFYCVLKLGFVQLICKASLIFKLKFLLFKPNLIKNACPLFLIDKVIKKYFDHKFSSNQNQLKDTFNVYYFKLPHIGNLWHHIENKLSKLCKEFCKENFT